MPCDFDKAFVEGNIIKDRKTGCWLWARYYGRRQPWLVEHGPHRMVYNLYQGVWLEANMLLVQTCEDKRCVNPDHMEERHSAGNPGSERDSATWESNGEYKFKKGRRNPKTKLDEHDVQTIKACLKCGFPQAMLAEYFGTNRSTVNAIWNDRTWKHVPWPSQKEAADLASIWCKTEQIGAHLARLEALAKSLS